MTNENENLQNLLVAGLHNIRPPIIESEPTPPATAPGTSPIDQLLGQLVLAVNQDDESDNAKALAGWENRSRMLTAAINEAIQQEEPRPNNS